MQTAVTADRSLAVTNRSHINWQTDNLSIMLHGASFNIVLPGDFTSRGGDILCSLGEEGERLSGRVVAPKSETANLVLSIQEFTSQTAILAQSCPPTHHTTQRESKQLLILSECGLRLYDWMTHCNNTATDSMSESGPGSGGGC